MLQAVAQLAQFCRHFAVSVCACSELFVHNLFLYRRFVCFIVCHVHIIIFQCYAFARKLFFFFVFAFRICLFFFSLFELFSNIKTLKSKKAKSEEEKKEAEMKSEKDATFNISENVNFDWFKWFLCFSFPVQQSFFGRACNKSQSIPECKKSSRCIINKNTRTTCKACRLTKCIQVGMSKGGSKFGRRSNWFKINFLLEEQQKANAKAHISDDIQSIANATSIAAVGGEYKLCFPFRCFC